MNASTQSKVYIEIVKQLRKMIDQNDLEPGDKIPSERELSERLNVGRSSVREALRSLELLGLIETRRGEGTFLKDGRDNQLVPLFGTFILQNEKAKKDVEETKYLIEMDCLRLLLEKGEKDELQRLRKWVETDSFDDSEYFMRIVKLANNYLFYRIWVIINEFYKSCNFRNNHFARKAYLDLTDALLYLEEKEVIDSYKKLRSKGRE